MNRSPNRPGENNIDLSVIISSTDTTSSLARCLRALLPQLSGRAVEVIVVGTEESLNVIDANMYPGTQFFSHPPRTSLPRLLGVGIRASEGKIIAITDSTSIVSANWIQAVIIAHDSERLLIGGAVEPALGQGYTAWAAYLCDYSQFKLPFLESQAGELPGNNLAFKREVLSDGNNFVQTEFWKTYWCQALKKKGIALHAEPALIVVNKKNYSLLPFLWRRIQHGRCFAGMRSQDLQFVTRAFYLVASPFLPVIFLLRILKRTMNKVGLRRKLFQTLPLIIFAVICWSFGEFLGYAAGSGKSCEQLS